MVAAGVAYRGPYVTLRYSAEVLQCACMQAPDDGEFLNVPHALFNADRPAHSVQADLSAASPFAERHSFTAADFNPLSAPRQASTALTPGAPVQAQLHHTSSVTAAAVATEAAVSPPAPPPQNTLSKATTRGRSRTARARERLNQGGYTGGDALLSARRRSRTKSNSSLGSSRSGRGGNKDNFGMHKTRAARLSPLHCMLHL